MATIVTRAAKGSPLTFAEADANFTNLNTAKTENSSLSASTGSSLVGHIASGTGATSRTVQSKLRDTVSVKDFGAIGNGVANDTSAIQAALTAASGASWALYFPSGTYIITAALTGGRNITIYGDGWRSVIKVASGTNPTHIIKFGDETTTTSIEVRDIELDGNKSGNPTGGDGLVVVRGFKANLFNVRVIDCVGDGIQYEATGSCFENYLYGISSYRNDGFGIRMSGAGVTDTHIIGGDIGFNALGGVVLASSCSVNNSTIWGAGQSDSIGILTAGVSFQIVGNRIEGHGRQAIYVPTANDYAYISGNKIYANSFTEANNGLYDGIYVETGAGFGTITGNKVYSAVSSAEAYSMRYAINFAGAHNQWTIAGNDLPLLVAGSPAAFKTSGIVVNGILSTDKCDFNWIRTSIFSRLSANITTLTAGAWTVLPFNVDDSDQLSEFSNGVFIPKTTGMYRLEIGIIVTPNAANESIGLALYTSAGVAVRRFSFARATSTSFQMVTGVIDEYLTAGVSYDIRYFVDSSSTTILAASEYTYIKIRAVAN
jgi:hypothetical protein